MQTRMHKCSTDMLVVSSYVDMFILFFSFIIQDEAHSLVRLLESAD